LRAGRASGAGNVSRASVSCGLAVIVVIRGFLSAAAGKGHARRSAGRLHANAGGDWGNEHRGKFQKQRQQPERCEMPAPAAGFTWRTGAGWQMLADTAGKSSPCAKL
jgi:hypothetical protein